MQYGTNLRHIGDQIVLVGTDSQDLSLPVDTYDSISGLVLCRHEYRIGTDSVHEDTSSSFYVIEVNVSELCYHVDDAKLPGDLGGVLELIP